MDRNTVTEIIGLIEKRIKTTRENWYYDHNHDDVDCLQDVIFEMEELVCDLKARRDVDKLGGRETEGAARLWDALTKTEFVDEYPTQKTPPNPYKKDGD